MTTRDVNPFIRTGPVHDNPFLDRAVGVGRYGVPELDVDDSPESEAVAKKSRSMADTMSLDNIVAKYRGPVDDPGSMDLPSEMAPQTPDGDEALDEVLIKELAARARVLKAQMASDKESLDQVKLDLWKAVGAKPVKKLHGVTFRPTSPKRSTDLKGLEADHPEIYDQYVTVTDPDPTEPGALYV